MVSMLREPEAKGSCELVVGRGSRVRCIMLSPAEGNGGNEERQGDDGDNVKRYQVSTARK